VHAGGAERRQRGVGGGKEMGWLINNEPSPRGNYGPTHPTSQARKCKLSSVLLFIVVN
jgi:hypothetical protein